MVRNLSLCGCILLLVVLGSQGKSAPGATATFVIDEQLSELTIGATTVFIVPFTDSDTQNLSGTITTELDFGTAGTFPQMADFVVTGAEVSPLDSYSLTLGSPPGFGVEVKLNDLVADVQTPNPPVTLTALPTGLIRYQFDAAEFDVILDEGMVVATGAVEETINLADEPASGAAPAGTFGQITFLNLDTVGLFTQIDALLELPIQFTDTFEAEGQVVTVDASGFVYANASFAVALSGLPGDFDGDVDVDGTDFLTWQRNPSVGTLTDWRDNYGLAESLAAVRAIPEPTTLVISAMAALLSVSESFRITRGSARKSR